MSTTIKTESKVESRRYEPSQARQEDSAITRPNVAMTT